ncbi:hypothetical protein CDAR_125571, partial [Caerostris darwini]
ERPAIDRFPSSSSRPDNLVTDISGGFHQCQEEGRLSDEGPAIDRFLLSSSRPDNPETDISGAFHQCQEMGIKSP